MPGCGHRGKPQAGFPRCPQPLEIAGAIPTFPPPQRGHGKVESPKAGLPTFPRHDDWCLLMNSERRPGSGASLPLQAHRSIRKCSSCPLPAFSWLVHPPRYANSTGKGGAGFSLMFQHFHASLEPTGSAGGLAAGQPGRMSSIDMPVSNRWPVYRAGGCYPWTRSSFTGPKGRPWMPRIA
jgi:hypothetical protein